MTNNISESVESHGSNFSAKLRANFAGLLVLSSVVAGTAYLSCRESGDSKVSQVGRDVAEDTGLIVDDIDAGEFHEVSDSYNREIYDIRATDENFQDT
jgi:hypothetical protein